MGASSKRSPSERSVAHGHWIGGEQRAGAGSSFRLEAGRREEASPRAGSEASPRARSGAWPRAGSEDLDLALESMTRARSSALQRAQRVEALICELLRFGAWADDIGARFGLARSESESELDRLDAIDPRRIAPLAGGGKGVAVVTSAWSQLVAGVVSEVAPLLLGGWDVVLLGSEELPEVAAAIGEAAAAAGLGGRLAVLHAPDAELFNGLERETVARVGGRVRGAEAAQRAARAAERAGVDCIETQFDRGRSVEIRSAGISATRLAAASFDRGSALGGLLSGSVDQARVDAGRFSRLTEELLEALEDSRDFEPVAPVDRAQERMFADVVRRALEQGATLIHGSTRGADPIWGPTVLTNVESRMDAAAAREPIPLLTLSRMDTTD